MSTEKTAVTTSSPYRLPSTVIPSFYDIRITPDLKNFTFAGAQKVMLQIEEPTSEIVFNSAEITIHSAVLIETTTGTQLIGTVSYDEAAERATVTFDGAAGEGSWELDLNYTGILNDKLKGFYRSVYKNADGGDEIIATTKFEPCDARRAFPCWDEPAFKARFKISLVIANELTGISNTALLKQTDLGDGTKLLEFATSICMSTYVVAYVIGKLESSKPVIADGKEIRVWSVPGKTHLGAFGLSAAKFSLEYFARYFQQPYPGDKLDLVAIPDFASGAMENFGCITFRETALLVDTKTASHAELERVAEVVMHENAHMWFGDFVTMSWWNGLWLNEAFATFMAAKALAEWKPEWKFWDGFNIQRAAAMKVDGLIATRSIEFPVNNPVEAREMFDVLTYEKGCAILRMLELYIGEENFRRGIITYLAKHQFANADTPDLWSAIEDALDDEKSHISVTDLMNSWVFQPGYPVISVEESAITGSITFSQSIFRYLSGDAPKRIWHVPVHVRATVSGADGKPTAVEKVFCLTKDRETFYMGENVTSVIVNAGGHGFYRVQYSAALRDKLTDNLGSLSASERFNFINDLWATVQSGQTEVKDYLATVGTLTCMFGETDVNVFSVIMGSLQTLRGIVSKDEDVHKGLLAMARDFYMPALARLGFAAKEGESSQDAQLRGSLVAALGSFGDGAVLTLARGLFPQYKENRGSVDTNLVGPVISTLAAHGGTALYDELLALKAKATTPQEETRFLFALAAFRNDALAERTLAMCLDGTVRTQDAALLVRSVLINPFTAEHAWKFVKSNWDAMVKKYPMQGISRMCEGVTALVSPELEADVRAFFGQRQVKGGEKTVRQYLEQLSISVRLANRERGSLEDLLLLGYQDHVD